MAPKKVRNGGWVRMKCWNCGTDISIIGFYCDSGVRRAYKPIEGGFLPGGMAKTEIGRPHCLICDAPLDRGLLTQIRNIA